MSRVRWCHGCSDVLYGFAWSPGKADDVFLCEVCAEDYSPLRLRIFHDTLCLCDECADSAVSVGSGLAAAVESRRCRLRSAR